MSNSRIRLAAVYRGLLALLIGVFLAVGAANAQNHSVVFPSQSISIERAIEQIEQQTGFLVSINHTNFNISKKVKLSSADLPVSVALGELLRGTGRDFQITGRYILIYPVETPLFLRQTPAPPAELQIAVPAGIDISKIKLVDRSDSFTEDMTQYTTLAQAQQMMSRNVIARSNYMKLPPAVAVKLNLLYGAGTLTPNLAVELGLAPRATLELAGSYNPWNLDGTEDDNKKLAHWRAAAEYRHWFCERFNGHFVGGHIFAGGYNISEHKIPLLFEKGSEKYRYKGNIYGVGVSYGYDLMLGARWNLEFTVGAGYGYMQYDKFDCARCGDEVSTKQNRHYFGPTKAGITLMFLINKK
ncbi:DUF3575 domain-containing protein [Alistipes sp. OttesenSCG-928-B03]|nr:DUF3575 domain-containing protein [Alistipes sp. OttesenSCG-928-B03]